MLAFWDWVVIIAFVIASTAMGLMSSKVASKNLDEYFLGGRTLGRWQSGLSLAATQFAADTPLLVTGLIATKGLISVWQLWIFGVSFLFIGFLLAPSWRRAEVVTDAELTELRYSGKWAEGLRVIKAIYFGLFLNCFILAWVVLAAATVTEPFLLWHQWLPSWFYEPVHQFIVSNDLNFASVIKWSIDADVSLRSTNNIISLGFILLVTMLYSLVGGLRAVVKTDIIQLGLMLAGTLCFIWVVYEYAGSFTGLTAQLRSLYPASPDATISWKNFTSFLPTEHSSVGMSFFAILCLQWILQYNSDGTGYIAQRMMACKTEKEAKYALVIFSYVQIVFRSLLWLPIGLGMLIVFPMQDLADLETLRYAREATFVAGMKDLMREGFLGIMFTSMFAALASTIDTHLNWGSSYLANDIFKNLIVQKILKKKDFSRRIYVWVARLSNVLILGLAAYFSLAISSIQQAWQIGLMLGAGIGAVLVLRWFWWRITAFSEVFSLVISAGASWLCYLYVESEINRLLIVGFIGTSSAVIGSFVFPANIDKLKAFYKKVHPPGYWPAFISGSEEASSRSMRILGKGLLRTLFCSITLFGFLISLGSFLLQSPAPNFWFADSWIFYGLILLGALAVIPLWIQDNEA